MRPVKQYDDYLDGKAFSNGLSFALKRERGDSHYRSRLSMLQEMFAGKNVVHVGFVDHDPISIETKRAKGKWLHEQLRKTAKRCVGIDINEESVRYVRDTIGVPDVYCADVTSPAVADILSGTRWDYIFLGEMIEHVPQPIDFLRAMVANFRDLGIQYGHLMLSTPNGLFNERLYHMRGIERINSDHRYLFTPYTLSKVMTEAGLKVESIRFCRSGVVKKRSVFKNMYYTMFPMLRPNLIAIGRMRDV